MISVIIPLYNKEHIIVKSLRSVLSQDYDDFEVVIVNDGSTDRSAEIVKGIEDSRIRLIEQENGGPSKARNIGTKHSKGDWIIYLDADDELCESALRNFAKQVAEHPGYNMYFGRMSDANGQDKERKTCIVHNPFRAQANGSLGIGPGSTLYSKDLMLKYPYDERFRRNEDMDLLYRIFHDAKIYLTNDVVVYRNKEYAAASNARPTIAEDYVGYIDIRNCGFWESIAKYQTFMAEWGYYPNDIERPNLRYCFKRKDIKAICMIIAWIKKHRFIYYIYTLIIGKY